MLSLFKEFGRNKQGATAIEYGLIATLISIAAIVSFTAIGTKLSAGMTSISGKLQ